MIYAKRLLLLPPLLFVFISLFGGNVVRPDYSPLPSKDFQRTESIIYQETFETGEHGWVHYDGTMTQNNWHVYNSGAPQGNAWWMGDTALAIGNFIGGYHNNQYLVLDTPNVLLPANDANLTFKLRFNLEPVVGATLPYTGKDACDVRISTDNGSTWTVINGMPAYNISSALSFGYTQEEGPGIAGWGGNSNGWLNAEFNLAEYASQTVKIRFAFASDGSLATADMPALFGMMVDDISIGTYTNHGNADGQMMWSNMVPIAGDLWHIDTVEDAPSPVHAMVCRNNQNTYNPGMRNYLVSPPIDIPIHGNVRADFMFRGSFSDPDSIPNTEYFIWDISIDDGMHWNSLNPPNPDPLYNPCYYEVPANWTLMSEFYPYDFSVSAYQGQTAKFRIAFFSDRDSPIGTGIMIDDFVLWYDEVAAPTDLTAEVNEYDVTLHWDLPGDYIPRWLHYGNSTYTGFYGRYTTCAYDVAIKWDADGIHSIAPYAGNYITSIKIIPGLTMLSYVLRIYAGSEGEVVYEQPIAAWTPFQWNEVTLTTPYLIPDSTALWIGYHCTEDPNHAPCGLAGGQPVPGYGDMINLGNGWTSGTHNRVWAIQAYVSATRETPVALTNPVTLSRDITAYHIYRDNVLIGSVAPNADTFTESDVPTGNHHYYITAVDNGYESAPSNTVYVAVGGWFEEIYYDDNSAEEPFPIGSVYDIAVRFDPYSERHGWLRRIKFYLVSGYPGPMFIDIYSSTGVNGNPGYQFAHFNVAPGTLTPGWNYVDIPAGYSGFVPIPFYVSLYCLDDSVSVGLDTDNSGHSYKHTSQGWEPVTEGELMIRAVFEECGDTEDNTAPAVNSMSLYPNPSRDKVTISFSQKPSADTKVNVYNAKGQLVRNISIKKSDSILEWDGTGNNGEHIPNGLYILHCDINNQKFTKKILLLR